MSDLQLMHVYELRVGIAVGRPSFDPVVIIATFDPVVIIATFDPVVITATFEPVVIIAPFDPVVTIAAFDPVVITATFDPVVIIATFDSVVTIATSGPVVIIAITKRRTDSKCLPWSLSMARTAPLQYSTLLGLNSMPPNSMHMAPPPT
jgi:hypothetical protein